MRRAVVLVTSNIAEGFSRGTPKDKIQFNRMAQGSLTELQNQLIIGKDIHYIKEDLYKESREQTIQVHKLISGLMKSLKKMLDT